MSSDDLDSVVDDAADLLGIVKPLLVPFTLPEMTTTDGDDGPGPLLPPEVRQFDLRRHRAELEARLGRSIPGLLLALMTFTFGLMLFGPEASTDSAVQVAGTFLPVISGLVGFVFGRQMQA